MYLYDPSLGLTLPEVNHHINWGTQKKGENLEFLDWLLGFLHFVSPTPCSWGSPTSSLLRLYGNQVDCYWIEGRTEIWKPQGQPWSLIWKKYIKEIKQTAQSQLCPVNSLQNVYWISTSNSGSVQNGITNIGLNLSPETAKISPQPVWHNSF